MDALHKWWFVFWAVLVATIGLIYNGLLSFVLRADITYIGICTIVLYFFTSSYIGTLTRRLVREQVDIEQIEIDIKPCWFASHSMMTLGMIGTVVGFLVMLQAFNAQIDPSNLDNVRKMIGQAVTGLSTSAVTTVVGLATALLSRWQLVNLEKAIDEARHEV